MTNRSKQFRRFRIGGKLAYQETGRVPERRHVELRAEIGYLTEERVDALVPGH